MAETLHCDVAIIGAGTAGLAAQSAVHAAGGKALLIDPYFAGTTCATVGCMPSKLLIAASHAAHGARTTDMFGVRVDGSGLSGGERSEDEARTPPPGLCQPSTPHGMCDRGHD